MFVKLSDSSSCSIKSIKIDFQGQGRIDNYFSNLYGLWYCALFVMTWQNCYWETVSVLSDHPRWMFKKNLMEFFVGLDYYLYYFYSGCTATSPQSHVPPECSTISWPYHMTWLLKFPCYLYLNPIVCFEVLN